MLLRYLVAEALKLRRSLVLLLCGAAPACVVAMGVLVALDRKAAVPLGQFWMSSAAFWAFAMLPLAVTALSVLLAQMEHGPRTWDHLLTLPGARPRLYLAKALILMALVAAMSALLGLLILAAAPVVGAFHAVTGEVDAARLAGTLARMAAASTLVCMLQLWTALHFRSFVPPLVLGIAGTFAALAATGARQGIYFPWLMAVHMLAPEPAHQQTALLLGGAGGLAAMAAMLVHLHVREA
ncbi:MAG: ABC transporter permease [Alphaproteobacteria bacterium]|nr:ABC transporter permease [Alphaproteobacteria bacterium]MBV9371203.1 ABC transporter permease [Alphaproteobacteria bacterium]MBV9899933.1 ABC transporter permease [Alphaproteobacteria bacterium]